MDGGPESKGCQIKKNRIGSLKRMNEKLGGKMAGGAQQRLKYLMACWDKAILLGGDRGVSEESFHDRGKSTTPTPNREEQEKPDARWRAGR